MSSSEHLNDDAGIGSSHPNLDLHYHHLFLKSLSRCEEDIPSATRDHEMEDATSGSYSTTSGTDGASSTETSGTERP
jgi:hypothetical protein